MARRPSARRARVRWERAGGAGWVVSILSTSLGRPVGDKAGWVRRRIIFFVGVQRGQVERKCRTAGMRWGGPGEAWDRWDRWGSWGGMPRRLRAVSERETASGEM